MNSTLSEIDAIELPDPDARRRLSSLVGIDDAKERLAKSLELIIDPRQLDTWVAGAGIGLAPLAAYLRERPPLFILAGDVGTGKTELAETIGDRVARELHIPLSLFRMSLSSRGSGLVGEMTKLITTTFHTVVSLASPWKAKEGARAGGILFIDEADALAQSRETSEMHHEDRAGVNALIRGIDDLARANLPLAVIMATNRIDALDPAVRRRAADIIVFDRPNMLQRQHLLRGAFGECVTASEISSLAAATGASDDCDGFTYSDFTQRLFPSVVLHALPDKRVTFELITGVLRTVAPTPSFRNMSR